VVFSIGWLYGDELRVLRVLRIFSMLNRSKRTRSS